MSKMSKICKDTCIVVICMNVEDVEDMLNTCIYCAGSFKQNPKKGTRWHPKSIPHNAVVHQGQGQRRHRVKRWHPGTQAL